MKISSSEILSKLYMGVDNKLFKEGDILEGKIIKIVDNIAMIEIEDLGILKVFVENDLDYNNGTISKFLVEHSSADKVEIKLLPNNLEIKENVEIANKEKEYISNILKEYNIKDDTISREILETLTKYNVDINEDNLIKSTRIYDKLKHILNIDTDEVVMTVSKEDNYDIKKANIANILIKNKNDTSSSRLETSIIDEKDLTTVVKEYLGKGHLDYKTESDLIKTIGFFAKYNIEPTLNNFRYILELKENSFLFSEDFKALEETIDKNFTNLIKKVNINKGSYKISIGKNNDDLKLVLNQMEELLKEDHLPGNKKTKEMIEELRNKIEFINEMNKELSFVYFPLNIDEKNYKGLITLLKKRKSKDGFKGKLHVFIDLKTKRLGDIKISCQIIDSLMGIKFINIAKKDLNLFESKEEDLRDLIDSTGYSIGNIEYLFTDDYSLLDSLTVNKNSTYFLDVQV